MGMGLSGKVTIRGVLWLIVCLVLAFWLVAVGHAVFILACRPTPLEGPAPRELAMPDVGMNATVERVIDGDTFVAVVDLGYDVMIRARIRLAGVDTPELKGGSEEERARAVEAKDFVTGLILGRQVRIRALKKDSFGRHVSLVWYGDGQRNLSDDLLERGLARKYVRD
jgi:endonuclease YncB( thermonuclease family)